MSTQSLHQAPPEQQQQGDVHLPPLDRLNVAIENAAHLLPAQGPITVFIHHNTLHAFEELPFDKAVQTGAHVFGCAPYLSEERYRDALERGRIRFDDLRSIVMEDLASHDSEESLPQATRLDIRLALMQYSIRSGTAAELDWYIEETDALRRIRSDVSAATRGRLLAETRRWVLRDLRQSNGATEKLSQANQPAWIRSLLTRFRESNIENWNSSTWEAFTLQALWHICLEKVTAIAEPPPTVRPPIRLRDLLLATTGRDSDELVHPLLARFTAAFLDQGLAHATLPEREQGLFRSFCALYSQVGGPPDVWLLNLRSELIRVQQEQLTPLELVRECLDALGVEEEDWEEHLGASFLALRGWGGMVRQVAERADAVACPIPPGSLIEFLAVRLLLDRLALAHEARSELGSHGSLRGLRKDLENRWRPPTPPNSNQRAFPVFQLAQILGWPPEELLRLRPEQWRVMLREIESFSSVERRRLFHRAYERRFREQTLDALALGGGHTEPETPRYQAIFCIDDREESLRRHLEEVAPDVETIGAAGFFNVPMYYRGAADAYFVPLCPVVIRPQHWVAECVDASAEDENRRRTATRRAVGHASHGFQRGTRGAFLGALLTSTLGLLAGIPLVGRVLFPRFSAQIRRRFGHLVRTPPKTCLAIRREEDHPPGQTNGQLGYTLAERINMGERLLRDTGLTRRYSRLVLIVGHGSGSVNNPHKSAYDCGACGGSAGGPNARAIAAILNDHEVRQGLLKRGIRIPESTRFVGGYHNTCDDSVQFLDTDSIPETHRLEFQRATGDFAEVCDRNAHERCRRFYSASPTLSFRAAREHVESRSEDLSQTRPELGHATNAICHVGRRARTRGLFLDRRAFLTSYDPTQDDAEGTILARILGAVFPVCAGINLEYYFSHVDPVGYGAGTKLPHNITSMLGVMDGAASDLRTGLPWQMVEIHEPVRLLIVVETTSEILLSIMERNEGIGRLIRNGWVQVATQDPTTGGLEVFQNNRFEPYRPRAERLPVAGSSVDWYRGWRDHLEFARIGAEDA